jgi:hypothetical protein
MCSFVDSGIFWLSYVENIQTYSIIHDFYSCLVCNCSDIPDNAFVQVSSIDYIIARVIGKILFTRMMNSKLLCGHIFWSAGESIVTDLNIELPLQFVIRVEC